MFAVTAARSSSQPREGERSSVRLSAMRLMPTRNGGRLWSSVGLRPGCGVSGVRCRLGLTGACRPGSAIRRATTIFGITPGRRWTRGWLRMRGSLASSAEVRSLRLGGVAPSSVRTGARTLPGMSRLRSGESQTAGTCSCTPEESRWRRSTLWSQRKTGNAGFVRPQSQVDDEERLQSIIAMSPGRSVACCAITAISGWAISGMIRSCLRRRLRTCGVMFSCSWLGGV